MQNHFDLFQLPPQFAIDVDALDAAYHEVQNRVHPDKFVHAGNVEKRVAMQWATRANEAYQTLRSPLKRAAYLCEMHGVDLQTESNTAMPPAFLMQQMDWREALNDARLAKDMAGLDRIDAELRAVRKAQLVQIEKALDTEDFTQAALGVRQLMFLEKFGHEIGDAFAALEAV